jgi:hypothetical protein
MSALTGCDHGANYAYLIKAPGQYACILCEAGKNAAPRPTYEELESEIKSRDVLISNLEHQRNDLQTFLHESDEMCKLAIDTGMQQAAEWDRFWDALGVKSADITVDQAIEKYKSIEAEIKNLRSLLADIWSFPAHDALPHEIQARIEDAMEIIP